VTARQRLFGADFSELRQTKPRDMAVRALFGAAISVVAGLCGAEIGTVAGGLLLAFPAILPAALTLIEEKDGNAAAVHDVGGAIFGGVGLVAFAIVAQATLRSIPAGVALLAAFAAWCVVSLVLYVLRATGRLPLPQSIAGHVPPNTV
jgi:hypothetical protein